jgi:hypothetical protein
MLAGRRGRAATVLALVVGIGGPRSAVAYRPFASTDAAVAGVGEAEVELGYAGFRANDDRFTIVAPTMIGNIGVARGLEVVAEFKLALSADGGQDRTRFEDSAVSLKWVIREGVFQNAGTQPSLAVELSALLPTLRDEDRPGGELVGVLSGRALGWTYHLNGGALVEPGGNEPGVVWGAIVEHAISGPLRGVAEVNGESVRRSRADNSVLLGAIWTEDAPAPLHELSFDLGVRRGLTGAAEEWGGTAGVTFAFPVTGQTEERRP